METLRGYSSQGGYTDKGGYTDPYDPPSGALGSHAAPYRDHE